MVWWESGSLWRIWERWLGVVGVVVVGSPHKIKVKKREKDNPNKTTEGCWIPISFFFLVQNKKKTKGEELKKEKKRERTTLLEYSCFQFDVVLG